MHTAPHTQHVLVRVRRVAHEPAQRHRRAPARGHHFHGDGVGAFGKDGQPVDLEVEAGLVHRIGDGLLRAMHGLSEYKTAGDLFIWGAEAGCEYSLVCCMSLADMVPSPGDSTGQQALIYHMQAGTSAVA